MPYVHLSPSHDGAQRRRGCLAVVLTFRTQYCKTKESVSFGRLRRGVRLLSQWLFEEMNVINPHSSLAVDNNVQSDHFRTLSWL